MGTLIGESALDVMKNHMPDATGTAAIVGEERPLSCPGRDRLDESARQGVLPPYKDGAPVYSTPVNTGVAGAATANGTFPVYARYTVTTMSGTNPDGSHYTDPGIQWVSYFNGGDALHGFVRSSYGFPQSDGCVEMPVANAAVVYPLTPIGTLVTVQP